MRLDWRRSSAVLHALAVVAAALLFHTPAGASTIPVSGPPVYTNPGPAASSDPFAAGTWLRNNVRAGSSVGVSNALPHNGSGSIYFSGTDGVSKADLEYYGAPVFGRLGDLTSVG